MFSHGSIVHAKELAGARASNCLASSGLRNVAIHDYQTLSLDIVRRIIVERLDDFCAFVAVILRT